KTSADGRLLATRSDIPRALKTPSQQGHDATYGLEISERRPETPAVLAETCK
ncbi:hypothetical protein F442_10897, partial [Phytophthora nicotianae P10297]